MLKPDWNTAPVWARYWCISAYRHEMWFEYKPKVIDNFWRVSEGRVAVRETEPIWYLSLEERPENKDENTNKESSQETSHTGDEIKK